MTFSFRPRILCLQNLISEVWKKWLVVRMMVEVLSSVVIKKDFIMFCILYLMLLSFIFRLESEPLQSCPPDMHTKLEWNLLNWSLRICFVESSPVIVLYNKICSLSKTVLGKISNSTFESTKGIVSFVISHGLLKWKIS